MMAIGCGNNHLTTFLDGTCIVLFEHPKNDNITIDITPDKHVLNKHVLESRNGWFVNLFKEQIPEEVVGLLQLDQDFRLLPIFSIDNKLVFEFIKHLEDNFKNLNFPKNIIGDCRNRCVSILNKLKSTTQQRTIVEIDLLNAFHMISRFVKDHPFILFTKADKRGRL